MRIRTGEATMSSSVADRTEFWWNERKANERGAVGEQD